MRASDFTIPVALFLAASLSTIPAANAASCYALFGDATGQIISPQKSISNVGFYITRPALVGATHAFSGKIVATLAAPDPSGYRTTATYSVPLDNGKGWMKMSAAYSGLSILDACVEHYKVTANIDSGRMAIDVVSYPVTGTVESHVLVDNCAGTEDWWLTGGQLCLGN